ncbi:MAG: NADH-quinone oxidoreductase subunit NuoE [Deltaproteobacteria bacterium]|nr:NADH-quinone oxidoreductase subunit NuoE [Deltaproteobacteria bacterium]
MNREEIHVDNGFIDRMIAEKYDNDLENLIMILQDINAQYNYLPMEALLLVSENLGVPVSEVYGVATFYKAFSLEPRGKHIIHLCTGTACHVRGAERVKERLEQTLGIKAGGTTADKCFTLETVRCIGCCSLGPVVNVNDKTYARIDSEEIIKIVEKYNGQAIQKEVKIEQTFVKSIIKKFLKNFQARR